jgi:hypothetical protein
MATSKWLRLARGGPEIEVGIAVPIGCLVPIAAAVVLFVGAGLMVGAHLGQANHSAPSDQVVVRVIDDGAPGGPQVLGTAVVPLR